MKDKLKAIWRILRSKSYFYTVHVGGNFISNYEIGNQPKGGLPASARVDIMFTELAMLTEASKRYLAKMESRYRNPHFIDNEL